MKKLITILTLAGLFFTSCKAQQQEEQKETFKYTISLDVANMRGPVILLDRMTREPLKTIYPEAPEFKIEGELPIEKMHASVVLHFPVKYHSPYMYPVKEVSAIDFNIDRNTTIKAHLDTLLFADVKNDHMQKVEEFRKANFPSMIEFDQFNDDYNKIICSRKSTHEEQIAYANKGNELSDKVKAEIISKTKNFSNKEEMAVLLFHWCGFLGVENLDSLAALLDDSVKQTAAYKRILIASEGMKKQQTPPSLKVGDIAPAFELKDETGSSHALADFKGKFLIIDFWASWCGPCKREMPFMKELYEKYHSKGLEMMAISTDKDDNAWKKAMNKLNMPYLQLRDKNGEASKSYFVRGIPYVLFIGPKGDILAIERGEELEQIIKKHLNL